MFKRYAPPHSRKRAKIPLSSTTERSNIRYKGTVQKTYCVVTFDKCQTAMVSRGYAEFHAEVEVSAVRSYSSATLCRIFTNCAWLQNNRTLFGSGLQERFTDCANESCSQSRKRSHLRCRKTRCI